MKKVPSTIVKNRSRELTLVFESFSPYQGMAGQTLRIWITEIASDGVHLVGHTKEYIQVLVIAPESMLGTSVDVKITSVGRWSIFGEITETPVFVESAACLGRPLAGSPSNSCENCDCSEDPMPCQCLIENSCGQQISSTEHEGHSKTAMDGRHNERNFINSTESMLPRKRRPQGESNEIKPVNNQEAARTSSSKLVAIDWILLGGIALSFITSSVVLILLSSNLFS